MKIKYRILAIFKLLSRFKSHWWYWYRDQKIIAILAMTVSGLLMSAMLIVSAGFSIGSIIISVMLDTVGFWLAIAYLCIRYSIPELSGLRNSVDFLVFNQLVTPMIMGVFINRVSCFFAEKLYRKFVFSPASIVDHS